ncbi:MAG TPA: hypothetical protein VHT96_16455 [Clostridia bacterium]|nr:hypothetical protein [Clostridia bacterium]
MNWFRKFMAGRYGADRLSLAILIFSMLLTFLGSVLHLTFLSLLSYIPLILVFYRMLSKNIKRRSMENYKFSILMSPVYAWFTGMRRRFSERGTHRYLRCPACKAELRLPKGKGTIVVTCPKCRTEFKTKT